MACCDVYMYMCVWGARPWSPCPEWIPTGFAELSMPILRKTAAPRKSTSGNLTWQSQPPLQRKGCDLLLHDGRRDSKIVALAKKSHRLQMLLNKERANGLGRSAVSTHGNNGNCMYVCMCRETLNQKVSELAATCEQLAAKLNSKSSGAGSGSGGSAGGLKLPALRPSSANSNAEQIAQT